MYYTDDTSKLLLPPHNSWKPVFWTEMKVNSLNLKINSLGYDIIEFAGNFFKPPRGSGKDKKIVLAEWQKWLLISMFELKEDGSFRYSEVYVQLGRKNGKSLIGSIIVAYFATKGQDGDQIFIAAKDSGQAEIVFKEVKKNIVLSPELSLVLKVTKDLVVNKFKDITVKKLTSDAMQAHGQAPYITICDEIHAWDSEWGRSTRAQDLLDAITSGSGDRSESMVIYITTAGSNFSGVAYARYDKGKQIAQGSLEDDSFGFFCWEAEEHDAIDDPATWRKANPGIDSGFLPLSKMEEEYISASTSDVTSFERYRLNKWIKTNASEGYINTFHWDNAKHENLKKIPLDSKIVVGFDGSFNEDSTAFVGIDINSGLMEVLYKWEKDMTDSNWFVDKDEIDEAMSKIMKDYDVEMVYADKSGFETSVAKWIRSYGVNKVRDIPQSVSRMLPMGNEFREDLYGGLLKHTGDKRFREHALNAITSIKGMAKKEKPGSPKKIDFLICAILANGARREIIDKLERIRIMEARYKN